MSFRSSIRTVEVQGVVQTSPTPTSSSPIRTASTGQQAATSGPVTVLTPSDCKAGDLLLCIIGWQDSSGQGSSNPQQSGWTTVFAGSGRGQGYGALYSRIATATDAAGGASYSFAVSGSVSGPTATMAGFGGVTTLGALTNYAPANSGLSTIDVPSYASPKLAVVIERCGSGAGVKGARPVWAAPGGSGPASPQPAWEGDSILGSLQQGSTGIFAAQAPATPGAYQATITSSTGAQLWDYYVGLLS